MKKLGITLPPAPQRGGNYMPLKCFSDGRLVYCSGFGSRTDNYQITGKLGGAVTKEQGYEAARNCMLNLLAAFQRDIGSLDKIKSFVKVLALVASENDFYEQPAVADGATDLLVQIFGDKVGLPARSAIGVNVLPGNILVEVEALIELKDRQENI